MRALGLTGPLPGIGASGVDRVVAAVDRLFALQGQDWRSSKWALGVRAPGTTVSDVDAAVHSGKIVRSWPMRGTVHLTRAEDIGWIQKLTGRRVLAGAPKRREFLGMSDSALECLVDTSLSALAGGQSLTRDELAQVWTDAGIEWKSNWRYHLIWWMCQNNLTTFGPILPDGTRSGGSPEPRLVLATEWIREPRMLEGEDALAELAARYVRGRGAVRAKDFAWWSYLGATEAKRGLSHALDTGDVIRMQIAGTTGAADQLWVQRDVFDAVAAERNLDAWHLLPAFDEHLLGYSIRDPQLGADQFAHIVPGKNGMFLATIVSGGRTVATWKRQAQNTAAAAKGDIVVTPLPGERVDIEAIAPNVSRWAEFHEVEALTVRI